MNRSPRKHAGRKPIPSHTIRVGGAAAMVPLLRERGVDADALLGEVGLSAAVFDHPDNVVPFAALCQALRLSAQRTGMEDFGLTAGERVDLRSLGVLGYLVANSDTLGQGLQTLTEFLHVHDEGAVPALVVEEGIAVLGYEVLEPALPGADQMTCGALAIALKILRELAGHGFALRGASIAYRRPVNASRFHDFFGTRVRFDADRSALMFDAHWLAAPVQTADPYMREILGARLANAIAGRNETVEDRIRRVVRTLIAAGRYSEDEVARAFGVSPRSLARRLGASGSGFRAVLDSARFDAARALLGGSGVTIVEIALKLGYADSSSFSRAFRRWSGTTPAQWRRGNAGG